MGRVRNAERGVRDEKQGGRSRSGCLTPCRNAGFTLLEVMIAVAILAMVLVTLLGVKNRSMQDVMLADHITTATLLAKREMTELIRNPSLRQQTEEEGEFEEEEFKDYTWKKKLEVYTFPYDGQNISITEMRVTVLWQEAGREEMVELVTYE